MSEVLITLAMLSFLVALSIPTMFPRVYEHGYAQALKKYYGVLSSATTQIMTNNSGTLKKAFYHGTDMSYKYGQYLEYNKTCFWYGLNQCWASSIKKLPGGVPYNEIEKDGSFPSAAILSDGTSILFRMFNDNCTEAGLSLSLPYAGSPITNLCGTITIDVNGYLKPPNTIGRDIFVFLLGSNGIYAGGDPHTMFYDTNINCNSSDLTHNGNGCANKVINEGALNY